MGCALPPGRRPAPPHTQPLAHATAPNTVWCADFKGDFRLGDGQRCYPLTISAAHGRYLLRCQALSSIDTARVPPLFAATFREYGLPDVLRTDNGPPFAAAALAGRTRLSGWWIKLGILSERIRPGRPAENGRLERRPDGSDMHLAGLVVCRQRPGTAKGILFMSLEDEHGLANVIVHPWLYERARPLLRAEPFLLVSGRLQRRDGTSNVIARRVQPLGAVTRREAVPAGFSTARSHDWG